VASTEPLLVLTITGGSIALSPKSTNPGRSGIDDRCLEPAVDFGRYCDPAVRQAEWNAHARRSDSAHREDLRRVESRRSYLDVMN
jgi:hypothetical protein